MKYTDMQRVRKIYETATMLNDYIVQHGIQREALLSDYAVQWLVTTPLYNIGEQVYHLSDEFKAAHK